MNNAIIISSGTYEILNHMLCFLDQEDITDLSRISRDFRSERLLRKHIHRN